MHLELSSGKWRPICPGLNVLTLVTKHSGEFSNWKSARDSTAIIQFLDGNYFFSFHNTNIIWMSRWCKHQQHDCYFSSFFPDWLQRNCQLSSLMEILRVPLEKVHLHSKALHGPLTRYVKLRVAHTSGIPGTFSRHRHQKKPLVGNHGIDIVIAKPAVAGKTFAAFTAHARPAFWLIWQKDHVTIWSYTCRNDKSKELFFINFQIYSLYVRTKQA